MPKLINLSGRQFGSWTVKERGPNAGITTRWLCHCSCGVERLVQTEHLRDGASTNCGCMRLRAIKHGATCGGHFSPAYRSWRSMRARVLIENHKDYPRYGGRGITICDRWNDFAAFLADMGERPSLAHSIDRLDSNGNYEPNNCRWATQAQQVSNLPQNQRGYRHRRGPEEGRT